MRAIRLPRTGFTLTELVMVISAVAVIATLATTLLTAMMRQQTATTTQLAIGNSLLRMGDRFRKDVNAAVDADVTDDGLTLTQPGDILVSWRREPAGMVRALQVDGDVRNDYFDLLSNQTHSFTQELAPGGAELIGIEIVMSAAAPMQSEEVIDTGGSVRDPRYVTSSRGTMIIAQLGRDHRWQGQETESDLEDNE